MDEAENGRHAARAFLRIGGRAVAAYQLSLAKSLGCEKVFCIAAIKSPELDSLQQDAEEQGLAFQLIAGARDLSARVTVADELIVLADGLWVRPEFAIKLAEWPRFVAVQPIDVGLAAGFERIDLDRASGGLLKISGKLAESLNMLPSDCDVISSLTRIALQAGVSTVEIPLEASNTGGWRLIRCETDAYEIENDWIGEQLGGARSRAPGFVAARFGVQLFASSMLDRGRASNILVSGMLAGLALAFGAAWFGLVVTALAICGFSWLFLRSAVLLARLESAVGTRSRSTALTDAAAWLFDAVLIGIFIFGVSDRTFIPLADKLFAPVMLILLLRLLPASFGRVWSEVIRDRLSLALLLALCAALGVLSGSVMVICIVLVLAALAVSMMKRG